MFERRFNTNKIGIKYNHTKQFLCFDEFEASKNEFWGISFRFA